MSRMVQYSRIRHSACHLRFSIGHCLAVGIVPIYSTFLFWGWEIPDQFRIHDATITQLGLDCDTDPF